MKAVIKINTSKIKLNTSLRENDASVKFHFNESDIENTDSYIISRNILKESNYDKLRKLFKKFQKKRFKYIRFETDANNTIYTLEVIFHLLDENNLSFEEHDVRNFLGVVAEEVNRDHSIRFIADPNTTYQLDYINKDIFLLKFVD